MKMAVAELADVVTASHCRAILLLSWVRLKPLTAAGVPNVGLDTASTVVLVPNSFSAQMV